MKMFSCGSNYFEISQANAIANDSSIAIAPSRFLRCGVFVIMAVVTPFLRAQTVVTTGDTTAGATSPVWTIPSPNQLTVGNTGTGTLDVESGGQVNDVGATVGSSAGANGSVTVNGLSSTGSGSTWTSTGQVTIGQYSATNNTVSITNGGVAYSAVLQIGIGQTGNVSTGVGTLTISGPGSSWSNVESSSTYNNSMTLGYYSGSSGTVLISDGGQFINGTSSSLSSTTQYGLGGYASIGFQGAGSVTVTDGSSSWTNTGAIFVGSAPFSASGTSNASGSLSIENGGAVTSTGGILGGLANNTGTVTVEGTNSSWTMTNGSSIAPGYNAGVLVVGFQGTGILDIYQGGTVSDTTGEVGFSGAGATGTVLVSDKNSTWANSAGIIIGYQNSGSSTAAMTVQNGGNVTDGTYGYIGYATGSHGTVTVTDPGSTWTMVGNLVVGSVNGTGTGTLTIQNGGLVSSALTVIANTTGGTGTVNVTGDATDDGTNGVLQTAQIQKGAGTATLNLNGGILRATQSIGSYLVGFTPSLSLGANGVFFDSNGYGIGVSTVFTSTGGITKIGAGSVSLTGASTYSGTTNANAGTLYVDGNQVGATGLTTVASGATLSGAGTIGGSVSVASGGTLAPGDLPGPGTLTIDGNLDLVSGSILSYRLGQANANGANTATGASGGGGALNDLATVGGNVTLAGTLDVDVPAGGAFDPGTYRLINYTGTLTGNDASLTLGTMPAGSVETVQTEVANQVNLIVATGGQTLTYWDGGTIADENDGIVEGGNGAWQNASGNSNWTNSTGTVNAPWTNSAFAIFEDTPGTVTVDDSLGQVTAAGMQFASNGYLVTGEAISLVETGQGTGQTLIRVGDGTSGGATDTATIASVLQGTTGLVKTDLGTLVLTGADTYSGATTVSAGTLQLGVGGNIVDSSAVTVAAGATLIGNATSTAQALTLAGTLDVTPSAASGYGTFTVQGAYTGTGTVVLNTCLNDGSPSNSDELAIDAGGSVGGTTTIAVQSVGGAGCAGAQTTGNGILVVAYAGTATGLEFALGSTVGLGGYAYTLKYVAGQGWFLQSLPPAAPPSSPVPVPVPDLGRMALTLLALLLGLGAMAWRRRQAD